MKKIYSTLIAFGCIISLSYAQPRIGLLGGPQSSSVLEKNNIPGWDAAIKPGYSPRPGLHIGVLVEAPLTASGDWFLHPGILYQAKGRKFLMRNDTDIATASDTVFTSQQFFTNYIEFPVNLVYKIPLNQKVHVMLSAGPYVSFFYNGKQKSETRLFSSNSYKNDEFNLESGNEAGKVKTMEAGVNARAGLEIGSVMLSAYASRGLTDFYTADYDGSFKHQVIGASLGIWLNKTSTGIRQPKDSDKDGIPDAMDECPTLPGSAATQGCPDRDGDGIADSRDKCPDIAGLSKYNGCPIPDRDQDGVNDEEDKCPDEPGSPQYGGCPLRDTDGDGISDNIDACPDKAGPVEFNGCPIPDSDGDGLNDKEDKCPGKAGPVSNMGCPLVKEELISQLNYAAKNILFNVNSDVISDASYIPLNELIVLLSSHSTASLIIEGHTDATGSAKLNKQLSQRRAESVLRYLVEKGIDRSRLSAIGYGSERPIASNATKEGQAINRRVALKLEKD